MKRTPRRPRPPRAVLAADRKKIVRELNLRCRPNERGGVSFAALRLRAIVMLAAGAALRVGEVCKLNVAQFIDLEASIEQAGPGKARWKLRSLAYVRPEQSKGRRVGPDQWDSAGTIMVSDLARSALRAYLTEARRRGWIAWPPKPDDPLFIGVRDNGRHRDGPGRHRLSVRTLQDQWHKIQVAAGVDHPYVFHCLRHDAMTRCAERTNGNVLMVAAFGRCDVGTAMQYVHLTPERMTALRNELSFAS